jgi:hypothetical protein
MTSYGNWERREGKEQSSRVEKRVQGGIEKRRERMGREEERRE